MSSNLKKDKKPKGPKQLSRTVMAMKFMKRRIANEEQSDEYKIAPDDAWYADIPSEIRKSRSKPETLSYSVCMDLITNGHMSFGSFNKDVEKEMVAMSREDNGELSDSGNSVSDNEMAERYVGCSIGNPVNTVVLYIRLRYENLIGTLGKKVKRKKVEDLDFADTESMIPKKKRKFHKRRLTEQQSSN